MIEKIKQQLFYVNFYIVWRIKNKIAQPICFMDTKSVVYFIVDPTNYGQIISRW